MEIISAVSELGSFSYLFHAYETIADIAKEADPALVKLLEKLGLLKAEVYLMELLSLKIQSESLVENSIDSLNDVLSFLQTFVRDTSQGNSKIPKQIWMHVKPVARNASSVRLSFHAKSITEDKAKHELLKLLDQIKLLKMELLLEELLNRHPHLVANVKNQIEICYEGLILLRTFLLGPLEENGKLILKHVESVAKDTASFYYAFHANKITEDTVRKFFHLLPEFVENIKLVTTEIKEIYLPVRSSLKSNFPKIDGFGFMDFLLGDLMELLNSKADSIASVNHQIQVVHREMEFLRSFLRDTREQYDDLSDMKNLVSRILAVAFEVEYLIGSFIVGDSVLWYHALWVSDLIKDVKLIKIEASEISKKTNGINIHIVPQTLRNVISAAKIPRFDKILVDLDDQIQLMIDRLTRGSLQQDVVSIIGMPGLGKTTLAQKIYNDPLVTYHFHIRAWCCISQVYRRRELLLGILGDITELTENILEMSYEDLEMELYQCLKGKRYLIVMDDMWSIEAWNDLERSFPNDGNGSRIMITSRLPDVVSRIKVDSIPHPLRLLSDDECWKLLWKKLFHTKKCPDELLAVGKQIARSCKGLPLAVVAISGLLERTDMKPEWWKQVAETLSSRVANDPVTRCRDILELSYENLPDYLKPCFLYLGAFVGDKEIPVCKLKWLWVAEGFIQNTGLESVEDLAEEYLKDLIGRSLVIASKGRSDGGVKTCQVHDMLHTLCFLRCEEENFLQWKNGYDDLFSSNYENLDYGVNPNYSYPQNSINYEKRRPSICSKRNHFVMSRPSGPQVHSLLYFATSDLYPRCPYNISFISDHFKLLRVLDLESINMGHSFPSRIEFLVHLRYLALSGDVDSIPVSIAKLRNLETLIVKGLKGSVLIPDSLWSMAKLRVVHVNNHAAFSLQNGETKISSVLNNLVSLSSPSLFHGKDTEIVLRRLPKLRKLRCVFSESWDDVQKCYQFPVLDFLTELESLKVLYSGGIPHLCKFYFPLKLKKLTLSNFRLPWDCISGIGRLPNLEVLKLLSRAFEGKVWNMKEGEFIKLKFLKLDNLNIAQWNASSDHFPNLQQLVLRSCSQLGEVPSGFRDIPTLEMIEVQFCQSSAEQSVKRLKEELLEMGIEDLKVLINRSEWDFGSSV